jgi:hypothetical protein
MDSPFHQPGIELGTRHRCSFVACWRIAAIECIRFPEGAQPGFVDYRVGGAGKF